MHPGASLVIGEALENTKVGEEHLSRPHQRAGNLAAPDRRAKAGGRGEDGWGRVRWLEQSTGNKGYQVMDSGG